MIHQNYQKESDFRLVELCLRSVKTFNFNAFTNLVQKTLKERGSVCTFFKLLSNIIYKKYRRRFSRFRNVKF